jgi:aryl-alcohol dehydrogenase-like predicted oxidoreductase
MRYRRFGRLSRSVSEIGYGMWGMAGWSGADDEESRTSLREAVRLGCNFFDTAWAYGRGHSERLLGELVREETTHRPLYTASKIPPKNFQWPSRREYSLDDCFPPSHIREYTEKTVENLGTGRVDLMQFHVWEDSWARDERWQRAMSDLKQQGLISGIGMSVNRWEPWNVVETLHTGLVDAVQVIYNVFDQAPEDELFPLCRELDVAVIARVPFDEGTLTGALTKQSTFPKNDFRHGYFGRENLEASVDRAEALKELLPANMTLPELALRFILGNDTVSTVIPGMRKLRHVRANIAASGAGPLPRDLFEALRAHRWDRVPTSWSA